MPSMLEIGPGENPVISSRPDRCGWLDFIEDPTAHYTAAQPNCWRGRYEFPEELMNNARVNFIPGPIQDAPVRANTFDIVYAKDVLCDPETDWMGIVRAAINATAPHGTIIFNETCSPEYGPTHRQIDDFTMGKCVVAVSLTLPRQRDARGDAPQYTQEWIDALNPYSYYIRRMGTKARGMLGENLYILKK